MKTAEDIINSKNLKFVSVTSETTIYDAVKVMVKNKVGATLAIVVKSENNIVGIWTERDLMRHVLLKGFNPKNEIIKDHMVTKLNYANCTDDVETLMTKFVKYKTRHLLINKNDELIGMLADEDIISASLSEKTKEYNRLFELVGCGVFISASDGKFLNINQALLNMLGYDNKNEFLETNRAEDIYFNQLEYLLFQEKIETEKRVIDYEVNLKKKNGKAMPVLLTCHVRYDFQDCISGNEGIVVDLTRRKKMEQELLHTQMMLLQSEKLVAMGKLSSQLAHELNNPLFGIMNTLELLKTEISPNNRRRKMLDMSITEIIRLADMLKKMLSFSSKANNKKQNIDINCVIDEAALMVRPQLKGKNIEFNLVLNDKLHKIKASKDKLRKVFINMVSNAMEAMKNGGKLTISSDCDKDNIYIKISDTGVGIPEKNLTNIFESFFTTKESVQGVGLGLSASYGFIKEHGGDIKVESEINKGTTFTIILPIL